MLPSGSLTPPYFVYVFAVFHGSILFLTHSSYGCTTFFRLVYRDIKQENIGFDCRGDVKVFDMGLCKTLNPAQRSKDRYGRVAYGYLLTPRTGSGKCNLLLPKSERATLASPFTPRV
jgi:serine/threonine protein kinase